MRKIYMMLAAALVVFAANSCNKDNVSEAPAQDSMVVNFTAKVAGTKAVFNPSSLEDGAEVPVLWKAGDKLDVYVNEYSLSALVPEIEVNLPAEAEYSEAATWTHDFAATYDGKKFSGYVPEAPYTFYAFCPGELTRGFFSKSNQRIHVDILPTEQTPEQNTCDPKAMFIYSISETFDAWPAEVEMPEFKHMTAYGCVTLGSGIPAEAVVEKVKITANEGQYLAGDAYYYYAGEDEGKWADFTTNSRTETLTLNTASKNNIWFGCCPTTDLQSLTFEVYTAVGECYVVEKTISGKNFEAGKVAKMTINGFEKLADTESEKITYVWAADNDVHGFIIGSNADADGLSWDGTVVSQTFQAGEPALDWTVEATTTEKHYNIGCVSSSLEISTKRIKFGGTTATSSIHFNPVKFTITPTTDYKVESITVYVSESVEATNYTLTAKVGETVFIDNQEVVMTKTPAAITGTIAEPVSGDVEITISGDTAGVFYLYEIEIVLVK